MGATRQSGGCLDSATFRQTTDDLDDFGFVQTQADKPALLIKCFATSGIQATEALHGCRTGFEAAKLFGFMSA